MTGRFIAFEGPEGSGKSTQIRLAADDIRRRGYVVTVAREPGGVAIAEQIRTVLLSRDNCAMLSETEALLYSAARAQLVGEVIAPALQRGEIVLCDRFVDSTLAYQGAGRGLSMDDLAVIQTFATRGLKPHVRVLLDLPVEVGLRRRFADAATVNRLDETDLAFHERVRAAYLRFAANEPAAWRIVNADQSIDDVAARVLAVVREAVGCEPRLATGPERA